MKKLHICYLLVSLAISLGILTGCRTKTDNARGSWARGCDLSWLSEMEHDGVLFRDEHSEPRDCIDLLSEQGMNAVRLRVWVNHATGWSNLPDMVYLAKRAAAQRQRIMVDIHYSDFFADPHRQDIPAAWKDYDYPQLLQAVRKHTMDVLQTLKAEGIEPEWVQVGNETPNGMLWPVGQLAEEQTAPDAWERYAALTTAGYDAAKHVFPDICVIVHVDNAYERRDWFWQAMKEHGAKWDMIGLSHYPMMSAWNGGMTWQQMNELAEANVRHLAQTEHCPVMIAEIGTFANDTASATVMADFVRRMERLDACAGIFYWEPEVYGGWRPAEYIPLGWGSYAMGAFTPDGQPSEVMRILLASERRQ